MNHTTETIATLDSSLARRRRRHDRWACRARRSEAQRSVRSVTVVVIYEDADSPLELLLVQDQQPVQTFRTSRAREPLRDAVRLRGTKRCANDLHTIAAKHLINTVGELLVPVPYQEAEPLRAFRQSPHQLPGLLCHPGRARIWRAPGDMNAAAAQFDEEEHVEPLQPDRLHGEEIDGEQTLPMRSYEFAPGRARASADRSEATFPKPGANRCRLDRNLKALQFANDASIAPSRIFSREA